MQPICNRDNVHFLDRLEFRAREITGNKRKPDWFLYSVHTLKKIILILCKACLAVLLLRLGTLNTYTDQYVDSCINVAGKILGGISSISSSPKSICSTVFD